MGRAGVTSAPDVGSVCGSWLLTRSTVVRRIRRYASASRCSTVLWISARAAGSSVISSRSWARGKHVSRGEGESDTLMGHSVH
ncbi:hypothetical protein [Streptomyces sp. SID11385]|uniref:hypothetical protein n=1 Tax=Streptomyces sp. SID11385 TaxID=2706031 RepID=UPI0013C9EC23|nr:hypothetical protein [Streptomyces sp. SID11385]NEA39317.1 hypothetical protein [Streptomyces sp. SID11385]